MEARRKQELRKGVDGDASRRRRGEAAIQLRKSQKEEGLAKRRNMQSNGDGAFANAAADEDQLAINASTVPTVFDVLTLVAQLQSSDSSIQLAAIKAFRRALSVERDPPVQLCLNGGALSLFVQLLQRFDVPELQFEAAWALTNIASTEHTAIIAKCGAVPHLVKLLTSSVAEVREQSAWCLGNVAGDGSELRDIVLNAGALGPLIANIAEPASLSLLRNCTWSLSNFCRGKPQPALPVIFPAVQAMAMLLKATSDVETMADVGWALSYISDGDNDRIESIVSQGIVANLVEMVKCDKNELIIPALRTLGNIVTGTESQTQSVIDVQNSLQAISRLCGHTKKNVRKETCWLLSNIAAGTSSQISHLVNTPGLIRSVLHQLAESNEWDVRKEACWVICNIASGGTKEHVRHLVENGCIKPLCDLLSVGESRVLLLTMEALENVLKAGLNTNLNYAQLFDEADGINKLEILQEHENHEVYDKAVKMIEKYFSGEEEDDSENVAPAQQNGIFSFGFSGGSITVDKNVNKATPFSVANSSFGNVNNSFSAPFAF